MIDILSYVPMYGITPDMLIKKKDELLDPRLSQSQKKPQVKLKNVVIIFINHGSIMIIPYLGTKIDFYKCGGAVHRFI